MCIRQQILQDWLIWFFAAILNLPFLIHGCKMVKTVKSNQTWSNSYFVMYLYLKQTVCSGVLTIFRIITYFKDYTLFTVCPINPPPLPKHHNFEPTQYRQRRFDTNVVRVILSTFWHSWGFLPPSPNRGCWTSKSETLTPYRVTPHFENYKRRA